MSIELFRRYVERIVGKPLDTLEPIPVSGRQALESLWPLNEVFRPNFVQIRTLMYDASFEHEADDAIERFTSGDGASTWSSISAGAWRVLLERHMQAIAVCLANDAANNPLMPLPRELPRDAWQGGVMLFLLYGMKLPFPPDDRSGHELPAGSAQASLRRH